ncbi:MAG TPA: RpiB/LacA/LacB family sugar-phosphate isomerase [Candidatus Sulfotelmatobacter sp.]|nr:RpiB/LacA/LacB family sugar-phosphate isomerase [Candidatus Sulfotelmatobacter sp.]
MKIYLASDHDGFDLKEKVKEYLSQDYQVEDCGDFTPNPNDDYPLFIAKAAEKVSEDPLSFGIVFGKSGAGEEMTANKFKNVRAVLGFSEENVKLSREHNDANILSLGSEFVDFDKAKKLVDIFIKTKFSEEERHKRRIEEIKKLE